MFLNNPDGTLNRLGWTVTRQHLQLRKDEEPADDVIAGTLMLLQRQRRQHADERQLWTQLIECLAESPLID